MPHLIHDVQRKVFSHLDYFTFLNMTCCNKLTDSLVKNLKGSGYVPDVIVGISHGGDFPAQKIGTEFNLQPASMKVSHYSLSICGMQIEEIVGVYRIAKLLGRNMETTIIRDVEREAVENRNVLIVDDDSYSGLTLKIAKESIFSKGALDVKTGVLHTYEGNRFVDFSGAFHEREKFYSARMRFPWSKISPYYVEYLGTLK